VVSIAGNVSHSEVVDLIGELCQDWEAGDSQELFPASPIQTEPQVRIHSKRTEQSHLAISLRGLSIYDPDRYIIDLISGILGGSMSSRLFVEVREKRGLAYDIQSGVGHYCDSGTFTITAGVDSKRLLEAIDIILNQIAELKEFLSEEELEKAKKFLSGRLMLSVEDTRSVASFTGNQMLIFGKVKSVEEIIGRVNSVTVEDVLRISNNIFKNDRLNLAVVGPNRSQGKLEASLTL
jgi:predicted Zn-dependent peptidase